MPKPQTTAQVAQERGVSIRTVHRMIARGQLKAQKLPGDTGAYLINQSDAAKAFHRRDAAA